MFQLRSFTVGAVFAVALLVYCSTHDTSSTSGDPTYVDSGGDSSVEFDANLDGVGFDLELGSDVSAEDVGGSDHEERIQALEEQVESLETTLESLRECPEDMLKVSDYCVEIGDREPRNWGNASIECLHAGRRMCNADELIGLGSVSMPEYRGALEDFVNDDTEWTAEFGDPKSDSANPVIITFDGTHTWFEHTDARLSFRCCVNVLP